MFKRGFTFLLGMNLLALGIILNTKSLLGVGAINTLPYSLAIISNSSLGIITIGIYIIFIIIQILLVRQMDIKILLQFPFSFLFGFLIDIYNNILKFQVNILYIQYIVLILAILLTAMGAFLMIKSNIVLNPSDGIVNTIANVSNRSFAYTKNIFDLTMVALTIIICLFTKGYIIGVGIGTVLSALFIGRCISLYQCVSNIFE